MGVSVTLMMFTHGTNLVRQVSEVARRDGKTDVLLMTPVPL